MVKRQLPVTISGSSRSSCDVKKPTERDVEAAIAVIYSGYKDDPRLTSELMSVVKVSFQDCNIAELEALMSPTDGLAARCQWPPTLYDIATFRKERSDKLIDRLNFEQRHPVERKSRLRPFEYRSAPFRPYPKLWDAFATEAEIIDRLESRIPPHPYPGMTFDKVTQASKLLATKGIDEARKYIIAASTPSNWPNETWTPPEPKVDISDFPDRSEGL